MAADTQIELRVSRLENDRTAIYELIGEIASTQQDHSRRFDAVDRRFDAVETRLGSVETQLGSVQTQLGAIAATLTEVVRRLPESPEIVAD